jgi:hypothetical protein
MKIAKLIYLACLLPSFAFAEAAGVITHLSGVVHVTNTDGTHKMLNVGSEVQSGDTLKTELNTYTRLKFTDGGEVVLRPETIFKVSSYRFEPTEKSRDSFLVELLKGGMRSVTGLLGKRSSEKYRMTTKAATIGIRGTHFGAILCNDDCANLQTVTGTAPPNGLYTDTLEGTTVVSNAAGSVEVHAGSFSYTSEMNSPPRLVPSTEGIQVTMPLSISDNKSNGNGIGEGNSKSCKVK